MKLKLIVIAGPTACGKTRLGVELAHRIGSEILSADSRQVYRGLDLGTGKDLHEYSAVSPAVPYHLIDVAEPSEIYTLYHYQRDCYRLLREMAKTPPWAAGEKPLVMVGGTGLYIEAVLKDYRLENVPENPLLRDSLMELDRALLEERLRALAPERHATTDCSSRKRIVRALEIVAYGREHTILESEPLAVRLDARVFCVRVERSEVHERISRRVDERLEQGMVDEVRGLIERGIRRERLEMLGMEYREIAHHLFGLKSYEQMVLDLKQKIRHLAKRQETWFRGMERRGLNPSWIAPDEIETLLQAVSSSNEV